MVSEYVGCTLSEKNLIPLALVGRMFPQKPNMVKPKTSAVYADSGEFRTVLDDLRISDGAKRQNLINMVNTCANKYVFRLT